MPHRLSVSRAARLAGVSRSVLQSKISKGELLTFEGEVTPKDLLQVYPQIDLATNTELDRVTRIKDNAFGKRIRERVLPDPEVLMARLRVATKAHAITKIELARMEKLIENLDVLFQARPGKTNGDSQEISKDILVQVKEFLLQEFHNSSVDEELAPIMAKNELLNIMTGQVRLVSSGKEFFVSGNDSILEAALSAGINLNWGCSNGNCGLCKAKLISGKTEKISHHDFPFKEADKNNNSILMCCHTPVTNIEIDAEELGLATIPTQKIKCKVKKINEIDNGISELVLQTPRSKRLRFFAGQSVLVCINSSTADEIERTLPIASCPCDDRNIQFHILHDNTDEFSNYLVRNLKAGDTVMINGPAGDFIYDEENSGTVLFIAIGTGFAPTQGLIEHVMAVDNAASIELLRIQDQHQPPYLDNRCRSWADALDELNYDVLADFDETLAAVEKICGQLQPAQIFIAGPKNNIDTLESSPLLKNKKVNYLAVAPSGYIEPN
jgi:CDP-4-dehydro-6-deoxyglucose reductase